MSLPGQKNRVEQVNTVRIVYRPALARATSVSTNRCVLSWQTHKHKGLGLLVKAVLVFALAIPAILQAQTENSNTSPTTPSAAAVTSPSQDLFGETPKQDSGWQGLANLLEALAPSTDTSIPLSPSQITDRIAAMLDQGLYAQALEVIEKRAEQLEQADTIGTDVQLLFLRARALSGLGKHQEAIDVYRNMTVNYPELPEPWNNLAAEYVQLGQLDMARDALEMALNAHPNYAPAHNNMGQIQLLLAERAFRRANDLGQKAAGDKAEQTRRLFD